MSNEMKMATIFKMCLDESDGDDSDNSTECLITGEPLDANFITLPCGHAFNYMPIYREVCNQKCVINHREVTRIPYRGVKCPYCRMINPGLLPYRAEIESTKLDGVNWPERFAIMTHKCCYAYRTGKKKGVVCHKLCVDRYCTTHVTVAKRFDQAASSAAVSATDKPLSTPVSEGRSVCSHMVSDAKGVSGTRRCKKYAKGNNKLCAIHLKLNGNIE